jgi:hypothetical protein
LFTPCFNYRRAGAHARKAFRAGDLDAAERWTRLARLCLENAARLDQLRSPPLQKRSAPSGPVMLDPDGFSPSGIPNWLLNQRRLDRAGLRTPGG